VQAIEDAHRGQSLLHPTIARKVLAQLHAPPQQPPTESILSEAELRVLVFVAQGLTNRDISERLDVSHTTVRTHISRIFHKLRLTNRTQVALYALKEGLVDLNTALGKARRAARKPNGATLK
jgi:NarL family two-component system response regulator LiaR